MNHLQEMLRDGIVHAPHYLPSNNSDHLPMTLCAMSGLGASSQQLQEFSDAYRARLHEIIPAPAVTDWRVVLGTAEAGVEDSPDSYPALLAYFLQVVKSQGVLAVLNDCLPELLPGIALDAFHPIIRLGYGQDFGSDEEVAAALAYMVSVHRDLPVSGDQSVDLASALKVQAEAGTRTFESGGFGAAINELGAAGDYPQGSAPDLASCAATSLNIYRRTRNFFALHLVTATQAVRIAATEPSLPLATASMTSAILAAHLVLGSPSIGTLPTLDAPRTLDIEHSYKYCWACLSEYRAYGDSVYLDEISRFKVAGLVPAWVSTD